MIRLFNVSFAGSVLLLVISETLLLFGCYILAAYLALWVELNAEVYLLYEGGLRNIAIVVAVILLGLYFHDLYDDLRPRSRMVLLQQYCLTLGVAFLLQAALGYGKLTLQLPKWTMVYGSVFVLLVAPAWRVAFYALVRKSLPKRRVLFAGTSSTVRHIDERLRQRPEMGFVVMGFLADGPPGECEATPCLGRLADLRRVAEEKRPDVIVVGTQEPLPTQQLLDLRLAGFHLEQAAALYETVYDRVSTRDLDLSQMIFSAQMGPPALSVSLQNMYSYALGLVGAIVALPVMAVVALLVRVSTPGPVLFRQRRVGLHGTPFMVLKFRSMYVDAEAASGAIWASKNDPRVTPVGRWLRRLRLDELPQFVNVIRGEMSFVGPRPERPEYVTVLAEKIPVYNFRHFVKPGITGWAQINHKYGDSIEDSVTKLEYDLYYIKNLTPALDAYIIFHTLKVMLLQRGAQ